MFPRLVYESFRHQARRKLLAGIAITLGVAVATAMIAVATDIGDKMNRELRSYGANLIVTPQEDTLDEMCIRDSANPRALHLLFGGLSYPARVSRC